MLLLRILDSGDPIGRGHASELGIIGLSDVLNDDCDGHADDCTNEDSLML